MATPNATVQAGSGIIGDAAGTTVIVNADAAGRFGEGATLIVWPSGEDLDPNVHNYETMLVESKSGTTLTVVRGSEDDPTGLATFAEGDQIALLFPPAARVAKAQTQVITVGKGTGNGPTIDLGADAVGIVGLIVATIKDVNLDGGTPGALLLDVAADGSFDGSVFGVNPSTTSGSYVQPHIDFFEFTADDPAPLYGQRLFPRYLRFSWNWYGPSDLGVNARATVTIQLEYF